MRRRRREVALRWGRPVVLGAALALLGLAPGPAFGFVRAQTSGAEPKQLFWKQSCAPVTIYIGDFGAKANLNTPAIAKSIAAAAHAWSPDVVTCEGGTHPYFEIVPTLAPAGAGAPTIADDARNVVVFLTDNWTLEGTVDGKTPLVAEALAYTSVTKHGDGHISDVDILINGTASSWRWRNFDPGEIASSGHGATTAEYDLQAAITHEFGHFLGLAHTCAQSGDGERLKDDQGQDVPDCGFAPEAIIRTVMYFQTAANDTSKRVLSADDAEGVCAVYPARLDPKSCVVDAAADGCAVAPARRRTGLGVGVVSMLAALGACVSVVWRRRRARA